MNSWTNIAAVLSVTSAIICPATICPAGEIGFIEDFALAPDRSIPLEQLIPGTEEYYYFHCLHYQNNQQFDKVDDVIPTWIKRHGTTGLVKEIQNRQALLTYDLNPQQSLEYIRRQLNLHFNHQRETIGFQQNLPTQLDPRRISRDTLTQLALRRYKNLQGFEDSALNWLPEIELNPDQRRHLIQRLARPDHANLSQVIAADLNYRNSRGFGSAAIHRNLLLAQLDELLRLRPDLRNQTKFVNTYLSRLRPNNDVDWRFDPDVKREYLDRLWNFASRLAPAHNSLKAHILYQRLQFDRSQGEWNKQRFMTYIALPRNVNYINSDYLKLDRNRRFTANLNADFRAQTLLPPVGDDEPLVRSYLQHFFVEETSYKAYEEFINDLYLKYNFAEAKIVNGLGEPEQWYSMLPPERYQNLKQRIDLDFAPTNRRIFQPDDPVSLDLDVKNIDSLIVKVFEINTSNFYRQEQHEIDTDINLDGLIANHEQTFHYTEPPVRRVKRHFEFPSLSGRGLYVIDFIGNGKSSRAVIRKGKLRHLVRTSTAGHIFTVLNENNQRLEDASIWLDGHEYQAEEGFITVPFTNRPRQQPIILSHGGFSSLDRFSHQAENYALAAGIYVDRESLVADQTSKVIVRPALYVNDTPVTLSLLEDVKLIVISTDLDGVSTSKEISDFELFEDRESVFEFQTPARLRSIAFSLTAKVQSLSRNKEVDLSAGQTFQLNEMEKTDKIQDLHLATVDGRYIVEVRGKNGEQKQDQQVNLTIKHRDFRNPVTVALQSDAQGKIELGALAEIDSITANDPRGTSHTWRLRDDTHSYYHSIHAREGDTVRVPYMGRQQRLSPGDVSLLELRGNEFFANRFAEISFRDGFLNIRGLAAGDYDLLLKERGVRIKLRISAGETGHGYVLSKNRQLELRGRRPLQITSIAADEEFVTAQLLHPSKFTRVHVFATHYRPAYSVFSHLGRISDAEPYVVTVPKAESNYLAGRNIGDEIRYIIDRKYARKYPGNMLQRPSVLLNPWAVRGTETDEQIAEVGENFGTVADNESADSNREPMAESQVAKPDNFASLDFLKNTSLVLTNLTPDDDGRIRLERSLLGPHQHIHLVACDPLTTVYRSISLAHVPVETRDLRLVDGLDPVKHFTQQKQRTIVRADQELVIPDISTARFETYDNLPRVYAIYATLTNNPQLLEFGFILNWPNLSNEEKQTRFAKYACHELAFFVYQKDKPFFESTVKPYLRNKKDKTFLDRWLLDEDLNEFLRPWNHAQLNLLEQILLARRIDGELQVTARHVQDLSDMIPPNVDQLNYWFDTVIKGNALDVDDRFGLITALMDAEEGQLSLKTRQSQSMGGVGGAAIMPSAPAEHDGRGAVAGQSLGKTAGGDRGRANVRLEAVQGALSEQLERFDAVKKESADTENRRSLLMRESAGAYFGRDLSRRKRARQFYQKLDKTKEWAENNYYKLPISQQNAQLVTVNDFWRDFAQHPVNQPFYSVNFAAATGNFSEMILALAVLDLPFEAPEHDTEFDGSRMTFSADNPVVVFHEEIKPARESAGNTPILVSQNFFRNDDRYRYENNQRYDKYVTDEFVVHTVYGCQVVVTNPTSSPRKLDLLLQIPEGAIEVLGSQSTRSVHINLAPYNTQTHEYYFYFPGDGHFEHYPVHVSQNQDLVAFAEPFEFNVVKQPTRIDRQSWAYISQHGSREDILRYLNEENLQRTELDKIAFRMADERFFRAVTDLLARRHVYNHTLWSYGIQHNIVPAIRQFLQHADGLVAHCGTYLDSPLLTIQPVSRKMYQHLDYRPLVNARAHQLGRQRQILNDRFSEQYTQTMKLLSYRRELNQDDLLAVTFYMLLQDRIEEAISFFGRVQPDELETQLQYDYFDAYLAFYLEDLSRARAIADHYANYPVDRWRKAFEEVRSQLDEIEGANSRLVDSESRSQTQAVLADSEPNFTFQVESLQVRLDYQNLDQIRVNYYLMDIELLFSRNPFVQQFSGQFAFITPNQSATLQLPSDQSSYTFELPRELANHNVLVEITAAGQTRSQAYYSNSLSLQVIENYGQLRVTNSETQRPVPKAYVKVYARMQDGNTKFYKDGYTDLRGRFDYSSLNTNELDFVDNFALLVLSDTDGALVREARPPKQ